MKGTFFEGPKNDGDHALGVCWGTPILGNYQMYNTTELMGFLAPKGLGLRLWTFDRMNLNVCVYIYIYIHTPEALPLTTTTKMEHHISGAFL